MKQMLEEAAREYMDIPPVKAAIKCGDIEDLESHLKVAFKAGAEWQAKQSPWISVTMAIPNEDSEGIVQVKNIDGKEWEMCARKILYNIYPYITTGYITHWRIKE